MFYLENYQSVQSRNWNGKKRLIRSLEDIYMQNLLSKDNGLVTNNTSMPYCYNLEAVCYGRKIALFCLIRK